MNIGYIARNRCDFECTWKKGCCHRIKIEDEKLSSSDIDFLSKIRVHTLHLC